MTFEQAMASAKQGSTVKRTSWTGTTVTYDSTTDKFYVHITRTTDNFNVHITRTTNAPFTSNEDDMSASDWTTV